MYIWCVLKFVVASIISKTHNMLTKRLPVAAIVAFGTNIIVEALIYRDIPSDL